MTWTVPANTYPYGYNKDGNGVAGMGTMLTIAQLELKQTVYKLHPEFWRRYKALIQFALTQGVHLGVGTGWRIQPTNPDGSTKVGFAPPGNSNHEGFPADGKSGGAVAIDTVCVPGWPWMEQNLKAYGLRSFVQPSTTGYKGTNEPWHVQPVEIPAARGWRTTPWKLVEYPLPDTTTPAPKPPPDEEDEVTQEDIDKIVDGVWKRAMTFKPTNKPMSAEDILEWTAQYACNADMQTRKPT